MKKTGQALKAFLLAMCLVSCTNAPPELWPIKDPGPNASLRSPSPVNWRGARFLGALSSITTAYAVAIDNAGNTIVAGSTDGDLRGDGLGSRPTGAFVAKYDASGEMAWLHQFDASGEAWLSGVAVDASRSIYVLGNTYGNFAGNPISGSLSAFVMKLDEEGSLIWFQLIEVPGGYTEAIALAVDSSGNVYATGHADSSLHGVVGEAEESFFFVKYDAAAGALQWTRLEGVQSHWVSSIAVAIDASGSAYVTGETDAYSLHEAVATGDDTRRVFVIKYDVSGVRKWTRLFESGASEPHSIFCVGIKADTSGNIYLAGDVSDDRSARAPFVAKLDSNGVTLWRSALNLDGYSSSSALAVDDLGGAYVVGDTRTSSGSEQVFVARLDASGGASWTQYPIEEDATLRVFGIAVTAFEQFTLAGSISGSIEGYTPIGRVDAVIISLDGSQTPRP